MQAKTSSNIKKGGESAKHFFRPTIKPAHWAYGKEESFYKASR